MDAILPFLSESHRDKMPATPDEIAVVEKYWGHRIPEDHRRFLLEVGGYYGPLLDDRDGRVLLSSFLIYDVATMINELGFVNVDLEFGPELLAIGGLDSWRYCLRARSDGNSGTQIDYIDIDCICGDILDECGASLHELLAVVATQYRAL